MAMTAVLVSVVCACLADSANELSLARALYGDPTYVVLDEPNSSLDDEGDAALARAIVEASARKATVVVITHRTSVLSVATKLLVMRDGLQQAFGPRDEVLAALSAAAAKPAAQTASAGGIAMARG